MDGIETRADGACALKLRVKAPPDKGAANAAVIALIAKTLRVPKSSLTIVTGTTTRTKTIAFAASRDSVPALLEPLASAAGK